jgi:peptide deformylase
MSRLPIIRYPDPRLNKVAKPVTAFDARLRKLVADMAETMYDAPGIGLAAPQVNVHEQLVIIDTSESRTDLRVFINPKIVWTSPEKAVFEEGCLSVPGIYDEVERPAKVKVCALDVEGNPFELTAEGLMAVCVQHEVDHLRGFLFVEYLSQLKRNRIKAKMMKEEREKRRDMASPASQRR